MIANVNENKISHCIRKIKEGQLNTVEVWRQLNTFRSNPQLLYGLISTRKNHYNKQGLLFSLFHPNKSIKTIEGREPINSLLQELVNIKNLPFINYNQELNFAADALARQYKSCQLGNSIFQPSYKEMREMLNKSSKFNFPCKIKCVVGVGFADQYEPLMSLLIDDDNVGRENRKVLMSKQYNYCGVGGVALQDPSLVCAVYLFTEYIIQKGLEERK